MVSEAITDARDGETGAEVEVPVGPIGGADPERHSSIRANKGVPSQRTSFGREKRPVKPVIRLTYDEAGKSKDQPLTIVHRGVVIKIG